MTDNKIQAALSRVFQDQGRTEADAERMAAAAMGPSPDSNIAWRDFDLARTEAPESDAHLSARPKVRGR